MKLLPQRLPDWAVRTRAASLLFGFVTAVGCHASYPTAPTALPVVALRVFYATPLGPVTQGSSFSYTAIAVRSEGVYEDVTSAAQWFSSEPAVVRLTPARGTFSAANPGTADVVVVYQGFTDSIQTVVVPAAPATFPRLALAFADPQQVGVAREARATFFQAANISQLVTQAAVWTSSNSDVATVSLGIVTGVSPGNTIITATYNGMTAWYGLSIQPRRR